MKQHLSAVSVVVPDYDAAIAFYVGILGFTLCEDTVLSPTKRWVTVVPPGAGDTGCKLLLAKAADDAQRAVIGQQAGGRVFLFLNTDDFARDHARMIHDGVTFIEESRDEPYARVAVFEDPFGNRWDLIEPKV